jgi:hypothetical protein
LEAEDRKQNKKEKKKAKKGNRPSWADSAQLDRPTHLEVLFNLELELVHVTAAMVNLSIVFPLILATVFS